MGTEMKTAGGGAVTPGSAVAVPAAAGDVGGPAAPWLGRTAAPVPTGVVAEATATADAAARAAGVAVAELHTIGEMVEAAALLDRVWRPVSGGSVLASNLLKVLSHCGCYVVGAFRGGEMVGVCVGLLADFGLHSHIAGVEDALRGAGLGRALKLHQRAWSLARGIQSVTWTFDPLISRNAYFNLARLGARPAEYLADYYGAMADEVNAGTPSDRLLVRWELASPHVGRVLRSVDRATPPAGPTAPPPGAAVVLAADPAGRPAAFRPAGRHLLVGVPRDVETLRLTAPDLAAQWRLALRETLGGLLAEGAQITGFARDGWYIVDRTPEQENRP